MNELSLDEISDRVIQAVLDMPIFDKHELKKRIRPILSIWMKKSNAPHTSAGYINHIEKLEKENKLRVKSYQEKLTKQSQSQRVYRNALIEAIGIEEVTKIDKNNNH